jgi:hypothetical protein
MKNIRKLLATLLFTLILTISTFAGAGDGGAPGHIDNPPGITDPIVQSMMMETPENKSWLEEFLDFIFSIF